MCDTCISTVSVGPCIWKKAVPALTRALAREADLSDDDDGAPVGVGRECVVKESATEARLDPYTACWSSIRLLIHVSHSYQCMYHNYAGMYLMGLALEALILCIT